jgi:myo-inositol-1(or 4)-monophosphatase
VPETPVLLQLAKSAALKAGTRLLDSSPAVDRSYVHSPQLSREVKAAADTVLEQDLLQSLAGAQLTVLSEESGYLPSPQRSKLWFIVDPLDGTFNFIKGLGPCAVSIALWDEQRPIFGVLYDLVERQLAWGGPGLGAFIDDRPISVSGAATPQQASICTGFPARFDVENERAMRDFCRLVSPYAKVRMIGSAAMALLHVARGSADVYLEQSVMLWDVAAGIAIVQGAGGETVFNKCEDAEWRYDVVASNATLMTHVAALHSGGELP